MTGICCSKRTILSGVAVTVWAMAFDFIVHGNLLMGMYEANAKLWRPMEEMQSMWQWCVGYHLALGLLVAGGFFCWRSKIITGAIGSADCPYRKGMGFGLWVGLLLGVPQVMVHTWLPIDLGLPLAWMVAEIIKWTLAGLLLAKLYK